MHLNLVLNGSDDDRWICVWRILGEKVLKFLSRCECIFAIERFSSGGGSPGRGYLEPNTLYLNTLALLALIGPLELSQMHIYIANSWSFRQMHK